MSVSTNLLAASVSDIESSTSGWAAGTNTTLALGTRGFTGSASLKLTATAAGAVSATTVTRVAVTAGQVYTAYGYPALEAAASGRTVNVFIGWYNVASGGSPLSYSTSPNTTLASTTAFQAPPPILVATAPAGATYAIVGFNVTGLTAGQAALIDSVALGPVPLLAGNLLGYAAQSVEQDASAWGAWYGLTVGRSSAVAVEGAWSLLLTSTLAGNTQCGGASSVTTIPGTDYVGYASVQPGAAGVPFVIDLRWHDASDTYLGLTTSSTWTGLPAGTWTRISVTGQAPAGAVKARLVLRPQATAVGQTWLCDQMGIQVAAGNEAGNLLPYAAYSMEGGTGAWTVSGGGTIAASSAQAAEGVLSMVLTCTGTADAVVSLATPVPVTAGQAYRVRPFVRPPIDGLPYTVRLDWLNAGGQTIRQTSSGITAGAASAWTASYTSDLAPTGAVSVRPSIVRSGATAGEVWYVDRVYLAAGGLAAWAEPSTAGYGAIVHVQGLTTDGRTRWGLWRTTPDGTQTPVRGYSGDLTAETVTGDTAVVEDYEAPLGVPVAYYVKAWTASAGTDWAAFTLDWLTLAHPDPLAVVLKDPALPARNVKVTVSAMPEWKRGARQGVHEIRGRSRPVILTDVRASRTGSVVLSTATDAERQALVWLLSSGHTLLAQWPASWGESDVYIQVGDVDEARPSGYAPQSDREWTLALTEVDRPIGGLVGTAGRTWQAVRDGYGTWAGVLAGARTWLDVLTGVGGS